jgi:hypothetical protein
MRCPLGIVVAPLATLRAIVMLMMAAAAKTRFITPPLGSRWRHRLPDKIVSCESF